MAARLKEKYHKEIKGALQKELGLENPMAVPRLEKIVLNMGLGEATPELEDAGSADCGFGGDCGAEAGDYEGEEVDCGVQGPREHAYRGDGDAARRHDVRVSGSA